MQRITIGRYKAPSDELPEGVHAASEFHDGWIEGIRDDGTSWIMWLDANGNPEVFYANRDEDGGVDDESMIELSVK